MLALGLKDKVVGTSVWFGHLPKAYAKEEATLKRLSDNSPSFEAVVGQMPELVAAQYTYHVGPQGRLLHAVNLKILVCILGSHQVIVLAKV